MGPNVCVVEEEKGRSELWAAVFGALSQPFPEGTAPFIGTEPAVGTSTGRSWGAALPH